MTRLEADVVVVGSGIAGLTFALRVARGASVLLVTKKQRAESSTNYARGGIAAVMGRDDELALHVEDTLHAGAGLCHADVVELVVGEGPDRVRDLMAWGTSFHREGDGLSLGREGGHSRRRIVHTGDRTGRAIESALLDAAAEAGVLILEDHIAVDLLTEEDPEGEPRVRGLLVLEESTGERLEALAPLVLLATGGCGQIYRHTTNPAIATGDGMAMAYRAGARIANMEFIQFHPTALHPTEDPAFLISEALRGEGAVLRTRGGEAFMEGYHAMASLAPRDVVARAIHQVLTASGDDHVLLDIGPLAAALLASRFASTLEGCRERGLDPADGIPVVPAAHYVCGGVLTDTEGRSSLSGLLAAGEVACTGLHGANRLASNSLLEAVVLAYRAARAVRELFVSQGRWSERPRSPDPSPTAPRETQRSAHPPDNGVDHVRDLMWTHAGIVRTTRRLEEAAEELDRLVSANGHGEVLTPASVQARNVAECARLVVRSALKRRESRGLHFTLDHPYRDNELCLHDTVLQRDAERS